METRMLSVGLPVAFYTYADGFHPAGAIIDQQRGLQHISIYSGHPNGPAGIFRLTRSLDTPALRRALHLELKRRG